MYLENDKINKTKVFKLHFENTEDITYLVGTIKLKNLHDVLKVNTKQTPDILAVTVKQKQRKYTIPNINKNVCGIVNSIYLQKEKLVIKIQLMNNNLGRKLAHKQNKLKVKGYLVFNNKSYTDIQFVHLLVKHKLI